MNDIAKLIYDNPQMIGVDIGFKDLKPIHGEWIREMVWGEGDYTLMAHRAAYKSSCLSVAIALMMVLYPTQNIIFLRKADNDVSEMIRMVTKILKSPIMADLCAVLYGVELKLTEEAQDHISTSLWTSPMGASQLLGIGLKSSITGKHSEIVITDDICNVTDRISKAERDRTKLQYQELQNIRNRGGRIINLGTKWHKDDVFPLMDNIHIYDYHRTGLISDEQLKKIKDSMTASLFACNIFTGNYHNFLSSLRKVSADKSYVFSFVFQASVRLYSRNYLEMVFTCLKGKNGGDASSSRKARLCRRECT